MKDLLSRAVAELIGFVPLKNKRPLRVKLGIDPTSPNLHFGRAVPLMKLRDFQDAGHTAIFIVGDLTATIGDSSDKDSQRTALTSEQVKNNLETYFEQAGKIIDLSKAELYYNSKWLSQLTAARLIELSGLLSLNEFISRENIQKRLSDGRPVSLREAIYPLLQAYDSVEIKADLELGGTDQRFNMLTGRQLQERLGLPPQAVMTLKLLLGTDGRKASSSWGNTINLTDTARDIFGKTMRLPDSEVMPYLEALTRLEGAELEHLEAKIKTEPMSVKRRLANHLVAVVYGQKIADSEESWFIETFQQKKDPQDATELAVKKKIVTVGELVELALPTESASYRRRLIEQGAVWLNSENLTEPKATVHCHGGEILKIGKRRWWKLRFGQE